MQEKLLILRTNNKKSQKFMGELLNISAKQYGAKERGESKFNGDEMFVIANHFNKRIDEIFLPTTHQIGDKTEEGN